MKIAIPVEKDMGLDSIVYGHFGSAPYYLIYDTETSSMTIIDNTTKDHTHGQCTPASELAELGVNAIACNGMGMRAINKLNAEGIKVLFAQSAQTSKQIIDAVNIGALNSISEDEACQHHDCH